jgi:competence protein ComEA
MWRLPSSAGAARSFSPQAERFDLPPARRTALPSRMPPAERRALLLLLALGVTGHAVRYLLTRPGEPPGQVQLLSVLPPGSPRAQRDSAMRQARPLEDEEKIDIELASASEVARLPKIGLRLAKTIVADRSAHGPFGNLAGLDRVPGVGPGLLQVIGPHVVFGGQAATPLAEAACSGPPQSRCAEARESPVVNLNSATLEQLDALPGVGRAKAAAIVRYRSEKGPFSSAGGLSGVPGFGPSLLRKLEHLVTAP